MGSSSARPCATCGTEIPAQWEFCPQCSGGPKRKPPLTQAEQSRRSLIASRVGVVALAVAFATWWFWPPDPAKAAIEKAKWEAAQAQAACRGGVERALRDPDSAQFELLVVSRKEDGSYYVAFDVRAKNGFGGYGRQAFTCTYRDGTAKVDSTL